MPEYINTPKGTKEIPAEVISLGRQEVGEWVAAQPWSPRPAGATSRRPRYDGLRWMYAQLVKRERQWLEARADYEEKIRRLKTELRKCRRARSKLAKTGSRGRAVARVKNLEVELQRERKRYARLVSTIAGSLAAAKFRP